MLLCECACMRTTIDLHDGLYREAKTRAVKQGTTLKELVVGLIQAGLRGTPAGGDSQAAMRRPAPPVAIRKIPGQPLVQAFSNRQVSVLLEEEEIKVGGVASGASQGKP